MSLKEYQLNVIIQQKLAGGGALHLFFFSIQLNGVEIIARLTMTSH